MRLLYVGSEFFARLGNGAGMADEALCRALVARGHAVDVITVEGPATVPGLDVRSLTVSQTLDYCAVHRPPVVLAAAGAARAVRGAPRWVTDHGEGDTVYGQLGLRGIVACCAARREAAERARVPAVLVHPIPPELPPTPPGEFIVVPGASLAKGGDLAAEIARRMPSARFLVLSTYGIPAEGLGRLLNVILRLPMPPDDLLARMRVCLFPSRRETWPVAPRLAAMHGRPVVARDLPGTRDSTGAGAWYVQGDAPETWVAALHSALAHAGPFGIVPGVDRNAELDDLVEALWPV